MIVVGNVNDVRMRQTKSFVQSQSLRYPMVLAQEEASGLRVLMDDRQLAGFKGDPQAFMHNLRERLAGGEGDVKL